MASHLSLPPPHIRFKLALVFFSFITALVVFFFTPIPNPCAHNSDAALCRVADKAKGVFPVVSPSQGQWRPTELSHVKSKYAFATFLAGRADSPDDDPYFVATRLLTYQLLHAHETASKDQSIPFVVLVTENVSEAKRERLRKDGAVVVLAEWVREDWVKTKISTWNDVMTKLRLWELTQFERICFLDGDTVLTQPMDGIFEDPAVEMRATLTKADAIKNDEAPMPANYSFASVPEMMHKHGYPPTEEHHDFPNINYLNAGLMIFQPSLEMLDYYLSVMKQPKRFNPDLPEQNLLNYAHRRSGNMPWMQLGNTWNIHYPTVDDVKGGVKSLHDKWWAPEHADMKPYMESWRWRMEGYFEARDALLDKP